MPRPDPQSTVTARRRGRPPKKKDPVEDEGFGFDPDVPQLDMGIPALEMPSRDPGPVTEPAPEILALGPPPADAAGIQKWNYQLLSTRAWLVAQTPGLTDADRDKRVMQLTQAAARHFPMAAKHDLNESIKRDAEAIAGKKRAKAAGKVDRAIPSGSAKIIPIRRDA